MDIIAYKKKKTSWQVSFNEAGEIETGRTSYLRSKSHRLTRIPIFRAKLKYSGHRQGTRSVMIEFKGCEEDSLIAVLKGTGPCSYDMDLESGVGVMESLILQDDDRYEYHGDGWFTGVFTFTKRGNRIYILPYSGDITKELTPEAVAAEAAEVAGK